MDKDLTRSPEARPGLCLAVDIGGTFTDVAAFDPETGSLRFGKVLSTPHSLVDGITASVAKAGVAFADAALFVHGSTIAANTILERTGARTALVTTEGFRDVYEIGRINGPNAYNLFLRKHTPLVERALRFEVRERVLADGTIDIPLDDKELTALGKRLEAQGVEAVAILFINSYRNTTQEARAKALIQANHPGMFVSASHELSGEYGEFERCSTVAANAYVGPKVRRYLSEIAGRLIEDGFDGSFLTAQSTGGLCDATQAASQGICMLESGAAAGVIGAGALCRALEIDNAIAFDMGGTTAKVGVILSGEPLTAGAALIGDTGLPVQFAGLDIVEAGAGGGSIARVEDGALRVGPHSAGARPGPACYGLGGAAPTVTDANLVLGRLSAERFLGGDMPLDEEAARTAVTSHVAGPLSMDLMAAADGIVRIAVTAMSNTVRRLAAQRGLDLAEFVLVAYGGAGPLHAVEIARETGIRRVIVPKAPGVFSAAGLLSADLRYDYVRTWPVRLDEALFDDLSRIYGEMEGEASKAIAAASAKPQEVKISRAADMRYAGEERAVAVELPMQVFMDRDRDGIRRCFDDAHLARRGVCTPAERAEFVSLRTAATGIIAKPVIPAAAGGGATPPKAARTGARAVWFEGHGFVEARTFLRDALLAGNRIKGPAMIEEYASTTVLAPGDALEVDGFGNLGIVIGKRQT